MRLINRVDFLKMPAGTIFCKGVPFAFEGLSIKGDTIGRNDWAVLNPAWVAASESGEAIGFLGHMLDGGASYPMETDFSRDGCFEPDAIFLIFERADLETLRGFIDAAIHIQP